jgi:hypothetical protein
MPTDLDHDGVGELMVDHFVPSYALSEGVTRCEGPFAGDLELHACPMAVHPDATTLHAYLSGDLDGDGIDELVFDATIDSATPDAGWSNEVVFFVYPGDFVDGEADPLLTVHPENRYFYYSYETRGAVADLDGDGTGDLVWVEQPDYYPSAEGEVAVWHSPPLDGSNVGMDGATLHLIGPASDAVIAGAARRADGSSWLVLQSPGSLPMLADGTLRGVVDPTDTALFLAADGVAVVEDSVYVKAHVGQFDGDTLGDLLVVDMSGRAGWIYLGASLP